MTCRVAVLAETLKWPEDYILVWLPIARAEAYYHWVLRSRRFKTYAPPDAVDDQLRQLEAAGSGAPLFSLPEGFDNIYSKFFPDGDAT